MRCTAIFCVALFSIAFEPPGPEARRAAIGDLAGSLPILRRAFSADAPEFDPIPKPGPHDWLNLLATGRRHRRAEKVQKPARVVKSADAELSVRVAKRTLQASQAACVRDSFTRKRS